MPGMRVKKYAARRVAPAKPWQAEGALVAFPVAGGRVRLDGFWSHGRKLAPTLLVYVHGMFSNFHGSRLKKAFLSAPAAGGPDVLSFNNRGSGQGVLDERFNDCLADLDAALAFARRQGYRHIVLAGHSTGCQKIVYYQARRQPRAVRGLVLLGPMDDLAITRRDLGRRFGYWLARARRLVRTGQGDTRLPAGCQGFSARRFLSVADSRQVEARVFNYAAPLRYFQRVRVPQLAVFGTEEEYACRPVAEMAAILRRQAPGAGLDILMVRGADHGFHGREERTAARILAWIRQLPDHAP